MTNKIQTLSITILNSNYKFIFSIILYLLIYSCYYTNIAYNMGNFFSVPNEGTPQIAEPKEEIIQELQKQIKILENRNSFLSKNLLSRSNDMNQLKETTSDYLARLIRLEHERDLAVLEKNQLAKTYQESIEFYEKEQKEANELVQTYKRRYTAYKECFAATEEENQELRKRLKLSETKEEAFINESSK